MASYGIIGLVLTCVTTLIHLVGLSFPFWSKSGTVNYGLWKWCISGTCFDIVALKGWFKAVRAFVILALFSLGGAIVLGILRMLVFKDKKMISVIAMTACFTAAILSLGRTPPYACAFIIMAVKLNIVAGFCSMTSLVLHVIGIASPFWIKYGDNKLGLWKACWRTKCYTVNPSSWLKAVQAFVIVGLLALVAACLITFGRLFVDKSKTVVSIIATVFNLVAAGTVLLAIIVYAAEIHSDRFHFSFILEILSFFLSSGAAEIHVLNILKSRNSNDGSTEIVA